MAKNKIIRFAAGNPNEPFSGLWRMVVSKNDVYLGIGQTMGIFKVSLHESGVWILAATKESGVTFQNENRRAKQWNRPLEHAKGITRGPSIIVPRTSLGSRAIKEKEKSKKAFWFRGPEKGELVEFSLYFVKGKSKTNWASDETVIADIKT